jgi:glycosyltransferase involved in cell wall biosynthesis
MITGEHQMGACEHPLVSVVTPVYNGEPYLRECIESVLAQTYSTWEYIIVNNCSKDGTLEIAKEYARKDGRIHVYSNEAFLPIIANHNRAFNLIAPNSKYCKVVSADDWLFSECIARMVDLAEAHPSVGIVGS